MIRILVPASPTTADIAVLVRGTAVASRRRLQTPTNRHTRVRRQTCDRALMLGHSQHLSAVNAGTCQLTAPPELSSHQSGGPLPARLIGCAMSAAVGVQPLPLGLPRTRHRLHPARLHKQECPLTL